MRGREDKEKGNKEKQQYGMVRKKGLKGKEELGREEIKEGSKGERK